MKTYTVANGRNMSRDKKTPCDFVGFTKNKNTFRPAENLGMVRLMDLNVFFYYLLSQTISDVEIWR